MGSGKFKWRDYLSWGLLSLSVVFLFFAVLVVGNPGDTDSAASRLERRLEKRMGILDGYARQALEENADKWLDRKSVV